VLSGREFLWPATVTNCERAPGGTSALEDVIVCLEPGGDRNQNEIDPALQPRRYREIVHGRADNDHVGFKKFGDQSIGTGDGEAFRVAAGVGALAGRRDSRRGAPENGSRAAGDRARKRYPQIDRLFGQAFAV
jgi:hypothetical protein